MFRLMLGLVVSVLVSSCFASAVDSDAVFCRQRLEAAAAYSKNTGGSAVVVVQGGQIVFENYHNGANQNTAVQIHSGTKAFWSVLIAAAIEDGIISGYDEVIAHTIVEWKDNAIHPLKNQITLRHLVSLTSGLSQDMAHIGGSDPKAGDIYAFVTNHSRMVSRPGTRFMYGPSHYYAFGEFLARRLIQQGIEKDALQYLSERVFQPIGLEYQGWLHDAAGNPHIPNGCCITPRNWIKFGQLILAEGFFNGEQIINRALMQELVVPQGINSGHGVFLWLNSQGGSAALRPRIAPEGSDGGAFFHGGYTDMIVAAGAGPNRMYIIPSLDAIIVRQTESVSHGFSDNDFLEIFLP